MPIHAANLKTSSRLQRAHEFLKDGKWHSSLEICQKAFIVAVNSAMAELRENSINVECERRADRWYYRIV